MGFWTGLIIIVLTLELVRIALSSAVLIHVLRNAQSNTDAITDRASGPARGRQEMLRQQTIDALRGAMDEVTIQQPGDRTQLAVESIDRYTEALAREAAR